MTESSIDTPADHTATDRSGELPRAKSLAPLQQLLGFLWPHKGRMIAAGTALVFTAGAQLTLGYGVKILIDEGCAHRQHQPHYPCQWPDCSAGTRFY